MKVLNEKFERKVLNKVEQQKSKVTIVEENEENSE